MKLYEINGFYGTNIQCTIFVLTEHTGYSWYVVEGSVNVNCTSNVIRSGINVETIEDIDMFTSSYPIGSLEDLERAVNE